MPSASPTRGLRVVTDTDISNSGSRASRRRDNVVLPAPDGDDSTSSKPRRGSSGGDGLWRLLDILHLLAKLIDDGLERKPGPDQGRVGRLGAPRIGLAVELLRQEVEPPTDRLARLQQFPGCLDMGSQPIDLLL